MQQANSIKASALALVLAGSAAFLPCPSAQAGGFIEVDMEVPAIIGAAVGTLPDYKGSDDYTFGVAPIFRYTLPGHEQYVQLLANELTVNVLDSEMFRLGPLANYHFGRDDSIDDEVVKQMREIDDTVEVGGFADYVWTNGKDKRHRFLAGVKVMADVGDESDGFMANVSARYWYPVAKPFDLGISAGLIYQDDDYANHYFGVNQNNVGTSGLPFFTADGGVNEYYAVLGGILYLNQNWLVSAGLRVSEIAGDPADSPIVDQRGDSTQFIGGIGIGYAFW